MLKLLKNFDVDEDGAKSFEGSVTDMSKMINFQLIIEQMNV